MKMAASLVLLLIVTLMLLPAHAHLHQSDEALNNVCNNDGRRGQLKSKTYLSPAIPLRPGSVSNKFYYDIDFPRGHLALKSLDAEVVDDAGASVPLHEVYLHHWYVEPYRIAKTKPAAVGRELPDVVLARNAGVCGRHALGLYYGLGSETRRTSSWVPDPYGIEVGDPPKDYEEKWMLSVHAIDTRGAADRIGCTECRCDLYGVTVDEYGRRIETNYTGGLHCCYDQTRCNKVKEGGDEAGFNDNVGVRKVFFKYTVSWLEWSDDDDADVVPVKIYIFDVTDRALLEGGSEPACKVEYEVEECSSDEDRANKNGCVHVLATEQVVPRGGDVVFGVGHQHAGGVGVSLHGQDGRLLCASVPKYGEGWEAGNEAGYVVGMSTCYPEPGTVKVRDGEVLTIVSNYSSERQHTGVMGLIYILVAEHA